MLHTLQTTAVGGVPPEPDLHKEDGQSGVGRLQLLSMQARGRRRIRELVPVGPRQEIPLTRRKDPLRQAAASRASRSRSLRRCKLMLMLLLACGGTAASRAGEGAEGTGHAAAWIFGRRGLLLLVGKDWSMASVDMWWWCAAAGDGKILELKGAACWCEDRLGSRMDLFSFFLQE